MEIKLSICEGSSVTYRAGSGGAVLSFHISDFVFSRNTATVTPTPVSPASLDRSPHTVLIWNNNEAYNPAFEAKWLNIYHVCNRRICPSFKVRTENGEQDRSGQLTIKLQFFRLAVGSWWPRLKCRIKTVTNPPLERRGLDLENWRDICSVEEWQWRLLQWPRRKVQWRNVPCDNLFIRRIMSCCRCSDKDTHY